MKCEFVEKETSTQRANPLHRCKAKAAPGSRFCPKHTKVVREDPSEEGRQKVLAPKKPDKPK